MKLGIIVRADNTGLGNQTYELTQMLNPYKIMIIDFTSYNGNQQHFEWYAERDYIISRGFPTDEQIDDFLDGIDTLLSCETFYNDNTPTLARKKGVKTYLQYNYELFGNLQRGDKPIADVLISPSPWMIEKVYNKFYRADGYTINPTSGQVFVEINFREPEDYDSNTGLLSINDSITFFNRSNLTPVVKGGGVSYLVKNVVHTFSSGKFQQDLELALNPFTKKDQAKAESESKLFDWSE